VSILALYLLGLTLLGSQQAPAPPPGARAALQARLIEGLRRAEPGSTPEPSFLADARAGLRDLVEILHAGLPPGLGEEEQATVLSPVQEQWILDCARVAGRADVLPLAHAMLAKGDVAARAAAIRLIGAVGDARDLENLLGRALDDAEEALDRRLCDALAWAAGEILGRDEYAFVYVSARWRSLREPLLEPLILAMRAAPGAAALHFLAEVIQWRAAHACQALAIVQEIGRSHDPGADGEARRRIRPLLDRSRDGLCRAAALALGALEDHASIPELIALLEADGGLRANAHWALRRITGLSLPASPQAWRSWHRLESTWLEQAGSEAFLRLGSDDSREVADAIRSISEHPLAREDLATNLVELLDSDEPAIRTLACLFIPDLGDARALPVLLALLEDGDPDVSAAALDALRRMTRQELPCDAEAWKELLSRSWGRPVAGRLAQSPTNSSISPARSSASRSPSSSRRLR
jgi:HEAT repeat protein